MIWSIFILSLGLAAAREYVEPEYLEELRESGQDEEFARLLGVDVSLVRPADNEERSPEEYPFTRVSSLGDILLTEEQERNAINFNRYGGSRWPNGRIPYVIQSGDFTSRNEENIKKWINDFNQKVSKVKIVPRSNNEKDYVLVMNGNGCWSYLGRTGGQQGLSLQQNGCTDSGTVQHEFIHAAGMTHEQNRLDRDDNVRVLWDNIPENWHSQYEKVNERDWITIGNYDHYSVMHYPIWAPETYKDAFEIPDHINRDGLGQRKGVTAEDVKKLNTLYS